MSTGTPPADRWYSPTHQWARRLDDGRVEIGITHYAQDALGDVVFVDLPATGSTLARGEPFMVIESVKTASDVHAPVSGRVEEVNEALRDAPERLNSDPYANWLVRASSSDDPAAIGLADAATYTASLG